MCKKDLVAAISKSTGLKLKDSELALNSILESISDELANQNEVKLVGFGTFKTREVSARIAKNPLTGAKIEVPGKIKPVCIMSKSLKDKINMEDYSNG